MASPFTTTPSTGTCSPHLLPRTHHDQVILLQVGHFALDFLAVDQEPGFARLLTEHFGEELVRGLGGHV
jgi:hypothetical protein